jgi:S-layer protein (TIGR01564 family)
VLSINENDEEDTDQVFTITMGPGTGSDDDQLEINGIAAADGAGATGTTYGPEDFSDDNDDISVYMTTWGSRLEYDNEDENDLTLWHPEEEGVVDVWVAETGASATVSEGTTGECTVSTKVNPIPATVNKFDSEVTSVAAQNVITVGGPCANTVSAGLMGNPEVCYAGFEEGKATLKLVQNGANVALIVAGGSGRDTQLASRILQQYEDYSLSGMEMVATTVSESALKVEKVN